MWASQGNLEEAREASKTWNEVNDWQPTGPYGGVSQMPHVPEGATGTKKKKAVHIWQVRVMYVNCCVNIGSVYCLFVHFNAEPSVSVTREFAN
jgi:hypothetical protein